MNFFGRAKYNITTLQKIFSKVKTSEHTWGVVGFNIKIWKMSWIFVQSHVGKI